MRQGRPRRRRHHLSPARQSKRVVKKRADKQPPKPAGRRPRRPSALEQQGYVALGVIGFALFVGGIIKLMEWPANPTAWALLTALALIFIGGPMAVASMLLAASVSDKRK